MTSRIIKTNNEVIEVTPKNGTDFSLEELQEIVGGYIEILPLQDNEIMVINEEGKLDGLDYNSKATEEVQKCGWADFIVGDVLVCDTQMVK